MAATPPPFITAPTPAPALPRPAFVPPIPGAGLNSASSTASLSLCTHFPNVNSVVIMAIISHEFKATDLHKLNPTNCDKEVAYTFNGLTNQFKTYFDILAFHINNTSATSSFFHYTTHLVKLIAEYKWTAVYNYHSIFFNCRRAEMAAGDFSQWGKHNNDLLSKHVYAHWKPAPAKPAKVKAVSNPNKACRKFNKGHCPNTPCPWG
ncbi:hypothetical protein E4T56_gene9085 [Termitomyces sp. T112]|nr:hypothetical protein E4T56_gene9085 [Termitomyces sp. T112]